MHTSIPSGHRLIGTWYNGLGNGRYIRYQFTDVGAYACSSTSFLTSGTFAVRGNQLTLTPPDDMPKRYTFSFDWVGRGSFSDYLTLRDNATHVETHYIRDPALPRRTRR